MELLFHFRQIDITMLRIFSLTKFCISLFMYNDLLSVNLSVCVPCFECVFQNEDFRNSRTFLPSEMNESNSYNEILFERFLSLGQFKLVLLNRIIKN